MRLIGRSGGYESIVASARDHRQVNSSYPAVASSVPRARRAVAELAAAAGASEEQLLRVRLAASEALSNVVLHAYDGQPAMIHVTAAVVAGEIVILIADDGRGLRVGRESSGLGLGLHWMAQFSDELTLLTRPSGGLEVRLRLNLPAVSGGVTPEGRCLQPCSAQ